MSQINQAPQFQQEAKLRVDLSRATNYVYPEIPKMTFWQKLGRGLLKGVSFVGNVFGAVAPFVLGPAGIPAALGSFGLAKGAADGANAITANHQRKLANVKMPESYSMAGLFEPQMAPAEQMTDFIAPPQFHQSITDTVIQRNDSQLDNIHQL